MRLRKRVAGGLLAVAVALLVTGAVLLLPSERRINQETCRRLALTDATSGKPIRGVEDVVIDPKAGLAYLSAQDRWALEDALAEGAPRLPKGGLYRLPLATLSDAKGPLALSNLAAGYADSEDFHPHGIDLLTPPAGAGLLLAVNRRFQREGERWEPRPAIEIFALEDEGLQHLARLEDTTICRANDAIWVDEANILVTNDQQSCSGLERWFEALFGGAGTVVQLRLDREFDLVEARVAADELSFANGIALEAGPRPRVWVAATRGHSLEGYALSDLLDPDRAQPVERIALDGGPDNITADAKGLVVALHPNLLRLALYRWRWPSLSPAPSEIIAIARPQGASTTLFADGSGQVFSAATVGARFEGDLIIGSVTDGGLLVCRDETRSAGSERKPWLHL